MASEADAAVPGNSDNNASTALRPSNEIRYPHATTSRRPNEVEDDEEQGQEQQEPQEEVSSAVKVPGDTAANDHNLAVANGDARAVKFDKAQTLSAKYIQKQNSERFRAGRKKSTFKNSLTRLGKGRVAQVFQTALRIIHYTWLEVIFIGLCASLAWYVKERDTLLLNQRRFPVAVNCHTGQVEGLPQHSWPRYDGKSAAPSPASYIGIADGKELDTLCEEAYVIQPATVYWIIIVCAAVIFLVIQVWVRDLWDLIAATFGLAEALVIRYDIYGSINEPLPHQFRYRSLLTLQSELVLQLVKKSMGKMRPTFISHCHFDVASLYDQIDPDYPIPTVRGYHRPRVPSGSVALNCKACRKSIVFGMESFPAGRTVTATVGGIYLSLYLNAKLKGFSNYQTAFWKLIVITSPVLVAIFITTMTFVENNHFVDDIVYSMSIADVIAVLLYRAHYAAVFDYKVNHQYLPYSSSHLINDAEVEAEKMEEGASKAYYRFRFRKRKQAVAVQWPRPRGSKTRGVASAKPSQDEKTSDGEKSSHGEKTRRNRKDLIHPITPPHGGANVAVATPFMRGALAVPALGGASDGVVDTGGQQSRESGLTASSLAPGLGMDGTEERSDVSLAIRRMAISDLSNAARPGLKYRLSQGRYSLTGDRRRQRSSEQFRSSDEDASVTIRPYRLRTARAIRLMSGASRKSIRASKRSAGAMV